MGEQPSHRPELLVWLWGGLLALLVFAPVLASRGVVLNADMVFVPFQPWKLAWLGLDGAPPRAVPADAIVSALTHLVPGDLVQKAVLVSVIVLACVGSAHLVRSMGVDSLGARLVAGTLFAWNPYVYERFAIGHWGLMLGYAALPWAVAAALQVARGEPGWRPLTGWLALASLASPTGGLVATAVAAATAGRRWWPVAAVGAVLNLPWVLPGLLVARRTSDAGGAAAFAPDDSLAGLVALLGGGGIWKSSARAPELIGWFVPSAFAVLMVLGALAIVRGAHRRIVAVGLLALLLAAFPATAIGERAMSALIAGVPGAGLLRDSQKFVAPWVLLGSVGVAWPLAVLSARLRDVMLRRAVLALFVAVPLVLLPSLAWGLGGRFAPAQVPGEWAQVRTALAQQRDPITVVVPWRSYRRFEWNGVTASYDPAPRLLPGEVLVSADLELGSGDSVPGDDPRARAVGRALARPSPAQQAETLAALGVTHLLIEKPIRAAVPADPPGSRVLVDAPTLRLLQLSPRGHTGDTAASGSLGWLGGYGAVGWPVVVIDAVVALSLVGVAAASAIARSRRRSGSPHRS